ncbi:phosphoenolpyruvate--protein phosphotransferase [Mangrovibrevibacter kandeliae]|uniref:phosphoenolpyruvate--protein phosphotransferase n=1 Tax=Mangrovibrevibacter kandeliae TaxID=2968473 RepID=UPI002117CA15|nr:phosphoenolpyruvate--protein phosphotransferase [Aurantimonas sp. MSK8Z-1]MCQ8783906.1 phosphoenolpyruvate--protein phosphotransferase [Aurantimonas sp. CSK15Z-1]MCW4116625.1 phosphoenolpyruvate--protein phosphotransferase [Aurantimonas sp. MSK8Z-1]
MRSDSSGPRLLLRRIRELMAEPLQPQARLDEIVRQIAANMVAEVCSLYVLRSDGVLELYATEGLNPGAVHLAQLRLGEGLVGTIAATARPLNLPEAQKHPAFTYLPETGEEMFNSFLGVPILRAGRTLGVLDVQNKAKRVYRDEELEALETVAMVVAEMIAAGSLEGLSRPGVQLDLTRPVSFRGTALSEGIGLGHVILHEPRVVVTNLFNEDVDSEIERLERSLGYLRISIEDMLARRDIAGEGEHRAVLEAYRMFAHDRGWVRRLEEAIRNGLTAEAAVEKVQSDMRARMMHMTDPYIRERLHDFDDLAHRLLRQLMGRGEGGVMEDGPQDGIIVARSMGAAELLDYRRDRIRGLVLEEGAPTSHVVIVARALGVPVVGQVKGAVSMSENRDEVIIDGDDGGVHLRPPADVQTVFAEKVRFRAKRQEQYRLLRDAPAVTQDGVAVDLLMNAGLMVDLPQLDAAGAAGIGLFRTELQFMIASAMPKVSEQEHLYSAVLDAAGTKPVTFRTLDVGGDKLLPYLHQSPEENPALGYRAIRIALDRPALMRTQLRALLKAAGGRELKIMFPMVTELSEIHRARELIARELRHLTKFGHIMPRRLKLGVMIEVPSLLFQLDELMELVDFVSVGSNDLFQFFSAVDRGNTQIATRFDDLSPPFLRALKSIVQAGERHSVPVTLCGEMAGKPLTAMALLGLGFRSISMTPSAIGPVKAMLVALDAGKLAQAMDQHIASRHRSQTMRELLQGFAEAHAIPY